MITVSVSKLKRDLSELISRAAYGREWVIIASRGKRKAAIVSIEDLELIAKLRQSNQAETKWRAWLEGADMLRERTRDRQGTDSTELLRQMREERGNEPANLR